MSNIAKLLNGKILKYYDAFYRYNPKEDCIEFENKHAKIQYEKTCYTLQDIEQWDMQVVKPETETYKTDNIEFSVKETTENYNLQFQKFPDELRNIYEIEIIENISIRSRHLPEYDPQYDPQLLFLPGIDKSQDNYIITIPKSDISKDFFSKLFDLLENKLKEVKSEGVSKERQMWIVRDCKRNNACRTEYRKLKTAYESNNYNDFIKVLKDNIDWCRDNDILFASEIRYVEKYKPEYQYLTYEELIDIAGERYKDLVFEYDDEIFTFNNKETNICFWDGKYVCLWLTTLISYVQIGLAKATLK